ncbi:hypothetical protein TNCV_1596121 [Trichonephila clavipes]|nr:hypothetical protein TNCV_1596121 [Trichonephila clavipes]
MRAPQYEKRYSLNVAPHSMRSATLNVAPQSEMSRPTKWIVTTLKNCWNQELTIDELIHMHEQEQGIEEIESLDLVQSEDLMKVGSLVEGLSVIEKRPISIIEPPNSAYSKILYLSYLFASLHMSFLGFGWKRVAINSGPKNPKDLLKKRSPQLWHTKDIFKFVQSSKDIDADFNDENETNKAAYVSTSSEMRYIVKTLYTRTAFKALNTVQWFLHQPENFEHQKFSTTLQDDLWKHETVIVQLKIHYPAAHLNQLHILILN